MRSWRNWQTHQLEGLALARAWWFESTRPHQHFRRGNAVPSERSEPRDLRRTHPYGYHGNLLGVSVRLVLLSSGVFRRLILLRHHGRLSGAYSRSLVRKRVRLHEG